MTLRNRGRWLLLQLRTASFKWQNKTPCGTGRTMKTLPSQTQTHNCSISERLRPNSVSPSVVVSREFQETDDQPLQLMRMQHVCNPDILLSVNNWKSFMRIILKYDQDFRPHLFLLGAHQAILHVSRCISEGNFKALNGLLTTKAIREVKLNFQKLSTRQKDFVSINAAEIHHCFIYDVRLKESPLSRAPWAKGFDEIIPATKAEIFVVLEGRHLYNSTADSPSENEENEGRFFCNYKFEKSFENSDYPSGWIITQLNHFTPPIQF